MASIFNAAALLATNTENAAWLPWVILAFILVFVILIIFFLYLILSYIVRGIEILLGPAAKSKTGQIIFGPAVGIPLFIVTILTACLIIFFTNQAEIIAFFVEVFGK